MKTATYRRCRKRVALAAVVGALVASATPALLASDHAAPQPDTTIAAPERVNCTNHGGKAHTLQCAMRSLDRLPGGRWLKWAIVAVLLIWIPYRTTQHMIGFYNWLRSKEPTEERER